MGDAASRACQARDTAGDDVETIDGCRPCPSHSGFASDGEGEEEEAPDAGQAFLGCYCGAGPEQHPWEYADSDEGSEGLEACEADGHCGALLAGWTEEPEHQVGGCSRPALPQAPPAHPLAQVAEHWPAAVFSAAGGPPRPRGAAPWPSSGQVMRPSSGQVMLPSSSQVMLASSSSQVMPRRPSLANLPGGQLRPPPPQLHGTTRGLLEGPAHVEPPPRGDARRAAAKDGAPHADRGADAAGAGPSLEAGPRVAEAGPPEAGAASDGAGARRPARRLKTDGCTAPPGAACGGGRRPRPTAPPRSSTQPVGRGGKPGKAVKVVCAGDLDGSTSAGGAGCRSRCESEGPPPLRLASIGERSSGPCFVRSPTEASVDGSMDLGGTFKLITKAASPAGRTGRHSFVLDF